MISIIIATHNRCESLKTTLDSLLNLECNGSFSYEIIIADNNSNDHTREVVENFKNKFQGRLRHVFEPKTGKTHALNKAIGISNGEMIALTDDDVIVEKDWLNNISIVFNEQNCDAVGGRVLPVYPPKTPKWIQKCWDLLQGPILMHDYGDTTKTYIKPQMFPFVGANMVVKREIFDECGLFRTDLGPGKGTFGDDTEYFWRLEKAGKRLYYVGNAVVWHPVDKKRMNLRYIAKWFIASGRYYATVEQDDRNKLVNYFNIPRYIFRELVEDAFSLVSRLFNRREFLKYWIKFFRNIGRCIEYQRMENAQSKRNHSSV